MRKNLPPLRIAIHNSSAENLKQQQLITSSLAQPNINGDSDTTTRISSCSGPLSSSISISMTATPTLPSPSAIVNTVSPLFSPAQSSDNSFPLMKHGSRNVILDGSQSPVASPVPECAPDEHEMMTVLKLSSSECEVVENSTAIVVHVDPLKEDAHSSHTEDHVEVAQCLVVRTDEATSSSGRSSHFLFMVGFMSAVLNYGISGASPVITRYLQKDCSVPPMSINAIANAMVIVLYLTFRLGRYFVNRIRKSLIRQVPSGDSHDISNNDEHVAEPEVKETTHSSEKILRRVTSAAYTLFVEYIFLWLLALLIMTRSVTNLLSPRFTKATNSQLINLCAPFMVSLSSVIIYRLLRHRDRKTLKNQGAQLVENGQQQVNDTEYDNSGRVDEEMDGDHSTSNVSPITKIFSEEKLSVGMVLCMGVTLIGGAMIILALSAPSFFALPSFTQIASSLTVYDMIGMSIALFSTFVLSLNNIVLKITTTSDLSGGTGRVQLKSLSGENLFLFHLIVLGGGYFILCLVLREDLSVWTRLPPLAYALFVVYALCNYLIGNVVNLLAIKYFGATNTSSILALSLVSTITCSWLILGERIHNIYQIIGGVLVLLSISVYMLLKKRSRQ